MSRNKMAILISTICVLGLALLVCIGSVKEAENMNYSNGIFTFSFGGKAELRNTIELSPAEVKALCLNYGSKNVYVYPSSEEKIVVKEYLISNKPEALATVTKQENGEVVIQGSRTNNFILFGFSIGERIEVYVPETGLESFTVQTGSGNIASDIHYVNEEGTISVQAGSGNINWGSTLAKELSFQAGSGNIRLDEITGDTNIQTGSGNITADKITGDACVSAGSGNITLREFAGNGSISAGSGNIKVEANKITGDIEIETGSGNNTLELPDGLSFQFEAKTGSGNIRTDFDDSLIFNKKGNKAEGIVGEEPSCAVSMKANSGNVKAMMD